MSKMTAGVLAASVITAAPASAETFVEVFAGRSHPESTDVTILADEARIDGERVPVAVRIDLTGVKPSPESMIGARLSHWSGNLGVAIDASTLNPDVRAQRVTATASVAFDESVFGKPIVVEAGTSIDVPIPRIEVPTTVTVAALAMARLPVGSSTDNPRGAFTPYVFAGPVWLVTDASLDGKFGIRIGGGVRIPLASGLEFFAEYRHTRVRSAEAIAGRIGGDIGVQATTGDIRVVVDPRNHAGAAGLSFRF